MKIVLSPLAEFRLEILLNYLEENWGPSSKENFLRKFISSTNTISKFPRAYPRSTKEFDIHKCVVTRQTSLIYRIQENFIEIITVFDNRQDPKTLREELERYLS